MNNKHPIYIRLLTIIVIIWKILGIQQTTNASITPVNERTQQVQDAIVAAIPDVTSADDVTETQLETITALNLRDEGITALQSGDFSGMTALTNINLYDNNLNNLPDGIFQGLTALTTLRLGNNTVNPMPIVVFLEEDNQSQFKVVIPTGAPFEVTFPINATNNGVTSEVESVTIPTGSSESELFTISTTQETTNTQTVQIGTLPTLPRNHYGYTFARSMTCNRTPAVLRAILNAISGVNECGEITDEHLATIDTLNLEYAGLSELRSGDFAGLTSLRTLYLGNNNLTTLPADIFSDLSNLRDLYIQSNKLNSLPEDVFSGLSSIRQLNLHSNQLTALPKNLFSGLDTLTQIFVNNNRLTTLDPDIFSNVSNLRYFYIDNNRLTTIPESIFANITSLEQLLLNNNRLGTLPQGVFRGMSTPTLLWIHVNPIITLPLTITLEKVEEGQFKVVVPSGTPIDFRLHFTITNGTLNTESNVITVAAGSVESDVLTVTKTEGTTDAVSVDFDILTTIPRDHLGYELVKSADLPLEVISGINLAPVFTEGETTTRTVSENTAANVNIGDAVTATDANDDNLTYTLGGTDATTFDIDTSTGQLKTKEPLDYETKNVYTVSISVSDESLTDNIAVTINITDIDETIPNRAPSFTDGESTDRSVAENTVSGVNIGTAIAATDPDGNTLTYTLSGTDASSFDIDESSGQLKTKATLDYETKDVYTITVTVSDSSLTDTISVTININNVNEAPVFTEGNTTVRSVAENADVGTDIGTPVGATDEDGNSLTYTIGGTDADIFDIVDSSGQLKTKTTLDRESKSTYAITITVTDDSLTDIINVTIIVSNINEAPVFTEGESTNRTVAENTLDGVEIGPAVTATDVDGDTLIYDISGADGTIFELENTTGQLKTKTLLDFESQSIYKVTLTVTDGELTDSIEVTITVTDIDETVPNRAPTFTDGESTTRSIQENTATGVNIGNAVAATDPDGNTLNYSLGGTDESSFDIEAATGQLKTKSSLDHETKASYSVTVSVSDGELSDTIDVTIIVTDIDETPANRAPIFSEGESTTRTVVENTEAGNNIGNTISAIDADGDSLSYTLGGTDATSFDIVNMTGQLKTKAALDFETKKAYTITVTVTDGNLTDIINVTINVSNVNEAPFFTDGEKTTRLITENAAADVNIGTPIAATDPDGNSLTYTLSGTDATSFDIVKMTGQLKTKAALDYETKNAYTITVTVTDGELTDTITVDINVTDIDETIPNRAPIFTEGNSTTRTVAENTVTGTNIGDAITATDADEDTLTYTLGGTDNTSFDIDPTTGQLKTKSELNFETKKAYTITVTVTDGELTDTITVDINVTDIDETIPNHAPIFTEGNSTTRTVAENTVTGTNIGDAITATDADEDTLAYTLGGTDNTSFDIDTTTGQLKTKAELNYETKKSYSVSVTVSDNVISATIDVTINIIDINDAPVFTDGTETTRSILENTVSDVNIGTPISATDADEDTLIYTLGGIDASSFSIERTTGQLKTNAALDHESKSSYSVTVSVSDDDATAEILVTITVTDENEAPVFSEGESTTRSVAENTDSGENIEAPVSATDDDNDTLEYALNGTDSSSFNIDSTTGQLKTSAALDFEAKKLFSVTISVTDGKGGSDSISVTISITDIDENTSRPEFTGVCDRTPQVRDEIVREAGVTDCSEVTAEHLAAITIFNLQDKSITSLKLGDFDGMSNLKTLRLWDNQLTSLPEDIFQPLTSMTRLKLERNQLTTLPEDIFDGLTSLESIWLQANKITSLPEDIFDGLTSLDFITITENKLSSLPEDIFDGLSSLTLLTMDANQITSIPEDLFDGMSSLMRLYISKNKISTLHVDVFDGLTSLKTISLGSNDITSISKEHFDGLSSLTNIGLSANELTSLPEDLFDGKSALERLSLQVNKFTTLPEDVFDGLSSLKYLYLQHNEITSLPSDIFDGLSSLTNLDLNSNKFTSLPEDIFDGLSSLSRLELQWNRELTSLPEDIFDGLSSLEDLVLHNTALTSLPADLFDGLSSLTDIELYDTQITSLPDGIFDGLSSLTTLTFAKFRNEILSLTVSLEKVGDNQFKAVMPVGAPFSIELPISVTNGSISGEATSVTILTGSVESSPLSITRTSGTTAAVTVDIGTLPSIPSSHNGYILAKSADLPLEVLSIVASAPTIVSNSNHQTPKETSLLSNYPNPFNPETWIPYQLANPADVSVTIYNIHGLVVRQFALGRQPKGLYHNRSKAVYWDGRNTFGERVASGVYFYKLNAGDYSATRIMLIKK